MIRTAIISSLLRNQSCVMGIGLRCFGENIADADTATIISIIMPSAGDLELAPHA